MDSRRARVVGAACVLVIAAGCSPTRFAAGRLGQSLASGGSVWTGDDDPQLVAEAMPFALKTLESLVAAAPDDAGLLLATCRGFVSYAAGFVEPEAEALPESEFERAKAIRARAYRLHWRARGYCARAFAERFPEGAVALEGDLDRTLARAAPADVDLLFWLGASWGSAVSLALDRPERVAELPAVRSLFERALALDPGYDHGSLQEAMIPFESLSPMLGGSEARARERYRRALELAGGRRASPYVTWARLYCVARQERSGFREALESALAIDPDASPPDRLANLLAQQRARTLLARIDDLFFEEE
ncbi:MAG: hypothetical protein H6511_06730 [Holophagales bacterium]|nr:hypothetical protein [Holophagales bacterium]